MTDSELKDLVAGLAIAQSKTDGQIQKLKESQERTDKQIQETDKQIQELKESQERTDKQIQETSKQMQRTDIKIDKTRTMLKNIGINVDGINKSTGLEAEEFFYTSFKQKMMLSNIKFDSIYKGVKTIRAGKAQEIDILLENGSSVGIVEVKNKVKIEDLEQLQKTVDDFYYFNPLLKDHKIVPAIAGKIFNESIQQKALKKGFVVIIQVGNHMEQKAPKSVIEN